MKKTVLLCSCVALLGMVTGCDKGDGKDNDKIVITYVTWDCGTETQNNEERRLIKAYEDKNPGVKIKVIENTAPGDFYWTNIQASVVNNVDAPDVMMLPNLDWPLRDQYLLNIKSFTDNDPEFEKVPSSIRDACTFKSGIYAIPCRMNLQGYFMNSTVVNRDLGIETRNISVDSDYSIIEQIVDKAAANNSVVGLNSAAHFIDTMASVLDTTGKLGYFTWDGEKYNLTDPAFISGVQKARAMFDAGKTLDSYDDDKKASLGLDLEIPPVVDAWNKGKLALRYGYTYEIPDILESNSLGFSFKFIGNPGGKITIVGDYYGIYKNTAHPNEAYDFAKWMSFGREGFLTRMELYKAKGSINSLPMIDDEEIIEKYFDYYGSSSEMSGLEDAYRYIQSKSMVEGVKVVPGFLTSRQNKKTGITVGETENINMFELLNQCVVGGLDIASYAEQINVIANKAYSDWFSTNGSKYE